MKKTISKSEPKNYNKDLVELMKKIYAKIIVDICNIRKHDEDGGCDIDCVGTKVIDKFDYRGKNVSVIYMPLTGDTWCEEAGFSVYFPDTVKFSDSTLKMIKIEFVKIRELLVKNFNEIRELSGGKWYEQPKEPINPRHILGLCYDLYYSKDQEHWKLKFTPGTSIGAPDGGRWIPYDVNLICNPSFSQDKKELFGLYGKMYSEYGVFVSEASNYN